jgi:DNA-binding transcriptional LysR family regulator
VDLRQLTYFAVVAEEGHLGRAAERLCLSQPPLSRQIQALEAELGTPLFIRTSRGMTLTQAGSTLLRDAQGIRRLVGDAAGRARRAGLGQAGRLDVGVYGSSIFGLVPRVLTRFRLDHPDVEIVLHHLQVPEQMQALRHGRVVLMFERYLPAEPDVLGTLVAREPILLALSERHPLAAHDAIDVDALRNEVFTVGTAPSSSARVLDLCRHHGFEPRFASPASDLFMSALIAAVGSTVSLVPASMANVRIPGVAYRPLVTDSAVTMDLHAYHLAGESSPLLKAMLDSIASFRREAELSLTNGR